MQLDRFRGPTAADEMTECAGCRRTIHYEQLNDGWFCSECEAMWCDEDVKAVNEKSN